MKFLDDFEWEYKDFIFIVCVLVNMFASLIKDVVNIFGLENVEWLILGLKVISTILGTVYAVWKFLRLKPKRIIIASDDWDLNVENVNRKIFSKYIPKSLHKKGEKPLFDIKIENDDGSLSDVDIESSIDNKGGIILRGTTGGNVPDNRFILTLRSLS
ncbi:hypothetical protein BTO10_03725 [Vibrio chagasii]|uniref:Uncharacterized protein n=1 Tax=Vibrio chagasii TaxID=170679 RepID=A0A2S7VP33_9VIBR|nr:hypothetical protein [Vibrio chagasii]PQJ63913.1 hypothetical protein BTO10_03725 [Vibrio chagasii]